MVIVQGCINARRVGGQESACHRMLLVSLDEAAAIIFKWSQHTWSVLQKISQGWVFVLVFNDSVLNTVDSIKMASTREELTWEEEGVMVEQRLSPGGGSWFDDTEE